MLEKIREAWRAFIRSAVTDPFGSISAVLAAIVLCYGLWQIGFDLFRAWGWLPVLAYVGVVLGVVFYVLMVSGLANPFRPYRRQLKPDFLYNEVVQRWHINADGSRDIDSMRRFVFFEPPKDDDLCDTVFGSLGLDFSNLNYRSKDATVTRYRKIRDDAYSVFWKPKKGPIAVGEMYEHQFSFLYPPGQTAFEKSVTISSRVPVFKFDLLISTEREISRIEIKKNDTLLKFWDEDSIFAGSDENHVGLLTEVGQHKLHIRMTSLQPYDVYFVLVFLKNPNLAEPVYPSRLA